MKNIRKKYIGATQTKSTRSAIPKKPGYWVKYRLLVSIGLACSGGIFWMLFVWSLSSVASVTMQQYSPDDTLVVINNQVCLDENIIRNADIQPTALLDTGPSPSTPSIDRLAPTQPSICLDTSEVQVEIYMYHYVRPTRRDQQWSVVWNNSVTPETITQHYAHLDTLRSANKIHITTMWHIQKYQDANCWPHPRVIVLTFDDGRWDNFEYLLPLAREYKIPANLGIIADRISWDYADRIDSFMTYDEIVWMIESGYFEISGHSLTHTDLRTKNADQQRHEICTSTRSLEDIFWVSINTFIYPMWLYNQESMTTAQNCWLTYGLTTRDGTNTQSDLVSDPYQLYRKRASKWVSGAALYGE